LGEEPRLRYDVLYHTDLSRERGKSNGLDLNRLNWGNYDLVVVDESHNFRNGGETYGEDHRENRYLRLMNRVIRSGVKTKVLMLSATPVNNRFTDLRHQLELAYEGNPSLINEKLGTKRTIDEIFRSAQAVFNQWNQQDEQERTTASLLKALDFDFFEVLDSVTIARSRRHIEKYYNMGEIGSFPERLKPISLRPRLTDLQTAINYAEIYDQLMKLNLSVYIPTDFVFSSMLHKYVDTSRNINRAGREMGIRRLMSINLLKRLESSVESFRLTVGRIAKLIEDTVAEIDAYASGGGSVIMSRELTDAADFDDDDRNTEYFAAEHSIKIDLADMDYQTWRDRLAEDAETLQLLQMLMDDITPEHDTKLQTLFGLIEVKLTRPINEGNVLAYDEIHSVNVLTVIANESYDSFAKGLQSEIALAVADRPQKVEAKLFAEKFGEETALAVYESLIENGYVRRGELTEKYYEAKENGTLEVPEEAQGRAAEVITVLDSVYDPNAGKPENARKNNVEVTLDQSKLDSHAFRELWSRINGRSYYIVGFDETELVDNAVAQLNERLRVSKVYFKVEKGEQAAHITSKDQLLSGEGFVRANMTREKAAAHTAMQARDSVRYDLVGKLATETGLTRKAVAAILTGMERAVFAQFGDNPEEFIVRAAGIINEQKATAIIEHITYDKLAEVFSTDIFTEPGMKKGALGVNAMEARRHLYDYVIYDSNTERDFAVELEKHHQEVEIYIKLPKGFYISTPVGKYNPDWAIAFYEGGVKHIYFVAETKGNLGLELTDIAKAKAHCAREHFRAISGENVMYDVVDNYDALWDLVRK